MELGNVADAQGAGGAAWERVGEHNPELRQPVEDIAP